MIAANRIDCSKESFIYVHLQVWSNIVELFQTETPASANKFHQPRQPSTGEIIDWYNSIVNFKVKLGIEILRTLNVDLKSHIIQ